MLSRPSPSDLVRACRLRRGDLIADPDGVLHLHTTAPVRVEDVHATIDAAVLGIDYTIPGTNQLGACTADRLDRVQRIAGGENR